MLAKHMPLLLVFAGGCLSGAVLIGFLGTPPESVAAPNRVEALDRAPAGISRSVDDEKSAREGGTSAARTEVALAPPQHDEVLEGESPAESGSSLADVLGRLEATYRERLVRERALSPAPPPAAPVPAPTAPPVAVVTATPVPVATAPAPAAVAFAEPAPPPKSEPVAAPRAAEPESAAAPVAYRDDSRPREVHAGEVNNVSNVSNVSVGSVHLGDVVQIQQLAMLQYMQLLTLGTHTGVGIAPPARLPVHTQRRQAPRRPAPFSTSLTDPNNPWGFDFPPTVLAK